MISAASGEFFQASLVFSGFPELSNRVSVGSESGEGTPLAVSDGPRPRMSTFLAMSPVTMKPAMQTRSPVSTNTRVEIFSALEGEGGGLMIELKAVIAIRKWPAVVGCLSSQKMYWSGFTSASCDGLVRFVNPKRGPLLKIRTTSAQTSGR